MLPQVNALIVLFQAPSTRIRIFLNPQLFLSGFKNFHSTRICIQIKCIRHVWGFTLVPKTPLGILQQDMRRKAREVCLLLCLRRTWERGCHLEYSIHSKELSSILLCHRIKKYPELRIKKKKTDTCGLRVFIESFTSTRDVRHNMPFYSSITADNEIVFDWCCFINILSTTYVYHPFTPDCV